MEIWKEKEANQTPRTVSTLVCIPIQDSWSIARIADSPRLSQLHGSTSFAGYIRKSIVSRRQKYTEHICIESLHIHIPTNEILHGIIFQAPTKLLRFERYQTTNYSLFSSLGCFNILLKKKKEHTYTLTFFLVIILRLQFYLVMTKR